MRQRAWEIIQRQWTRGMVTNLCHWHCDLCRQFVTHEPGDLCDITEKNIAGDQRWDSEPPRDPAPGRAGCLVSPVSCAPAASVRAAGAGRGAGAPGPKPLLARAGAAPATSGFEFLSSSYCQEEAT